jgi:hypothetical protein
MSKLENSNSNKVKMVGICYLYDVDGKLDLISCLKPNIENLS